MLDQFITSLSFVGLGLGVVALVCVVEMLLSSITNRFGTPQLQR